MELLTTEKFTVWESCGDNSHDRQLRQETKAGTTSIVFSAHGDTCFGESSCRLVPGSHGRVYYGHMDNFAGVNSMMQAYFSGKLPSKRVQCNVTYGEEKAVNGIFYAGARDVMKSLSPDDFVAVIDVTGHSSRSVSEESIMNAPHEVGHVVIEKVRGNHVTKQLLAHLSGYHSHHGGYPLTEKKNKHCKPPYTFETYDWCSDPHAFEDETDAYRETQRNVVFLGLQTCGGSYGAFASSGDYNAEEVFCWKCDIEAMSLLITDLAQIFVDKYEEILSQNL